MGILIIIGICLFFAGIFNGKMDYIKENNLDAESWKNKWKLGWKGTQIIQDKKLWYYVWAFTPKYVEAFPYSSTILVSLTDKWHENKLFMFLFIEIAISLTVVQLLKLPVWSPILIVVALDTIRGIGFYITHDLIKGKLL